MVAKKKRRRKVTAILAVMIVLGLSVLLAFLGVGMKYDRLEREAAKTDSIYRIDAFYYNHLTYKQQLLYDLILNAAEAHASLTDMLPYAYSSDDFSQVVHRIRADHPELFYVDFNGICLLSAQRAVRVELTYLYDLETTEKMQNEITAAIVGLCFDIVAPTSDRDGEFEVERQLHDRFVRFCTYMSKEEREAVHGTVYGALVLGEADAYGYAGAMKLLLAEYDIYSILVFGETDEGDHVWNMVYVDGKFYHLDTLWDDADLEFAEDIVFHGYFNLSTEVISTDHTMHDASIMPEAVDDGDYYLSRGLFVHNTMELDRIAYREILGAGYTGSAFIELYPDFDTDTEAFRDCILGVIQRINGVQDDFVLKEIFRIYEAANGSNALTVQLYYDRKIETSTAAVGEIDAESTRAEDADESHRQTDIK